MIDINGNVDANDTDVQIRDLNINGNLLLNLGSLVLTNNVIGGNVITCNVQIIEEAGNTVGGNREFCP